MSLTDDLERDLVLSECSDSCSIGLSGSVIGVRGSVIDVSGFLIGMSGSVIGVSGSVSAFYF